MRVELSYGKGSLALELPDAVNATVIRKPPMPVLSDPIGSVQAALNRPVGSRPLVEEAREARSACILICDITRPVPNGLLLRPLVRALLEGGLSPASIRVLVATGLHRPNLGIELEELVGDSWVLRTVAVENHFARNDADHVLLGTTRAGTLVRLDRRFVEADLKIVTGLVEPHFMAGYSGGRKVIAPGVAHAETITTFHNARFMSDPRAENCVLEGNPLHREQLEIVRMLGRVLAVNVVIDEHRQLSFVNFGEVVESHLQAVEFIRGFAQVPVPRRFKTIVTSAAGYPLDKTYYQTVKGMVAPIDILESGGNLIVASECSEGMGSAEYIDAQRRLLALGADDFYRDISRKTHADIDEWQTQMQLKPMRVGGIHLYTTGLTHADRTLTGVQMVDSVADALARCVQSVGDPHVAIIPEGPYVVPVFQPTG
ncbi:MAG TPA: nickel-dependent lactate racemase, partial [Burkholderiales bacterium]|nr:nickel-dependent lactate racemase [Burkholderiales bacterium]